MDARLTHDESKLPSRRLTDRPERAFRHPGHALTHPGVTGPSGAAQEGHSHAHV